MMNSTLAAVTNPSCAGAERVPVEQLIFAIERALAVSPQSVDELVRGLSYSPRAIRTRLDQLQLEGRAHRLRVKAANWPGVSYRWHAGRAVDSAPDASCFTPDLRARQRLGLPIQLSVRDYPAINRRDPLVAALHGPAHQVRP